MAKAATERTERDFQLDVNQAVANTEDEIAQFAMGDEELEDDGDTSLEEMGEGLEGDDLEEEEEAEEEEAEGEESEEDDAPEAEAEEEAPEPETPQDRPQRGRPEVALREERDRRRAAEERAAALDRQISELNGRMTELSTRVNAPAKPETKVEPKPKPDMFADPEGYERWVMEEAEKRAEAKLDQKLGSFRQEQQQERENFLNGNLAETAQGPRGFEFQAAYQALTSLPRDAKSQATVARIIRAADPGQAVLDWFEDNGAEQFRTQIAEQLGLAPRPTRNGPRQAQRQQQPRHEVQLPPSLNSARGGGRQQIQDPEMLDDSDEAVARYAFRT